MLPPFAFVLPALFIYPIYQ